MFSLLGGIGWAMTGEVARLAAELPRYEDNIRKKIADIRWVGNSSVIEKFQTTAQKVIDELRQTNKPAGETEKPVQVVVQGLSLFWRLPLVLEPCLYIQSAGVSAVALLMAVAFWSWLWGPVGLPLSTPLTVCLGVLGKYVPQLGFIGVVMSDEPVLETFTSYYQRLVARDDDEAMEIVDEFLKTHAVEQQGASLICIAALPPGASAPTRYLCKRLRTRSPECKIVVGRWGFIGNIEENRALLLAAGADEVGKTP
jgi:hypothetical protein